MEMSPSMERSIKSESLFSPHWFLSTVLISLSFENDRSTEAVVTGMVAYVLGFPPKKCWAQGQLHFNGGRWTGVDRLIAA